MVPTRPPKWLVAALGIFGVALLATSIPGPFIIDECHYLVTVTGLSQGRLTVPGTEGYKPNVELFYFDPVAKGRKDHRTPADSTAPALYAPLALPFSFFGWRGLVALNILAYLLCAVLVFTYSARHATSPRTPYVAIVTFMFGTYCLEYAQGLWPHMLSMCLVMAALVLSDMVRSGARSRWAALAGLSGGVATGIRYQNLLYAGATGLSLLLWAPDRVTASAQYSLGVLGPLLASSLMNRLRNGWWNPVSKGPYYLQSLGRQARKVKPLRPLRVLWAKLFDFTHHPPVQFMVREGGIGAYLLHTTLKRALVQSCPWALTAMAALAGSWRRRAAHALQQRELRVITLLVAPLLLMFAVAGWRRTDGFCYKQRYFIDLLPMLAVALAWAAERAPLARPHLLAGAMLGANGALAFFLLDYKEPLRHVGLLYAPLLLAFALLAAWLMAGRKEAGGNKLFSSEGVEAPRQQGAKRTHTGGTQPMSNTAGVDGSAPECAIYFHQPTKPRWLFGLLMAASIAWSAAVHIADDIPGSRTVRHRKGWVAQQVSKALPPGQPAALMAHFPLSVNLCSLHLDHDVVVGDTQLDGGLRGRRLVDEFLERGRRVFLVMDHFYPAKLRQRLLEGRSHTVVRRAATLEIVEITR